MAFLILFSACLLIFNLSSVRADSSDEQGAETDAMHEMEADETMAQVEMGGSVAGVVVNVNPAAWSLSVRDVDEDGRLYYLTVKKATTYSGISSLSDIHPGDSISVDCYGGSGNLIAETITLQDRAYQEEEPEKLQKVLVD